MKYCAKCGAELLDEAVICPKCGCPVNGSANQPAPSNPNASNGFAIAGFICAFIFPLLGFIFGCVGVSKANGLGGKGKGLAIAAIVISIVSTVVSIILYTTVFAAAIREFINNGHHIIID